MGFPIPRAGSGHGQGIPGVLTHETPSLVFTDHTPPGPPEGDEGGPTAAGSQSVRAKGSTIVVVIALLLALTFLGIVGYTIGVQEHGNATYFSDAAKIYDSGLSRDDLFDWGLRQVILGTRLEERQSALHGGHMSLLATLFGRDTAPYSGQGVNLHMNGARIFADYNDNETDDDNATALLEINRAPYARSDIMVPDPNNPGNMIPDTTAVNQNGYPEPDPGYTYWDNNSPFLAYVNEQHAYGYNGGNINPLYIPSFHRPQYLRSSGVAAADWYTDPDTQRRVLRPHREHRAVANDGSGIVTDIKRFVSDLFPDDRTTVPATELLLPFDSFAAAPINPTNDGIWQGSLGTDNYDADPDGDGSNEAVYLDLDFPMQTRDKSDGTTENFVPLFAFTIMDADALYNLNAVGNLAGVNAFNAPFADPFGGQPDAGPDGIPGNADDGFSLQYISRSNQGIGVSEINPLWAFNADPNAPGEVVDQHQRFFGHAPSNYGELANMEWYFTLTGRADLDGATPQAYQNLHQGRFGEVTLLENAIQNLISTSPPQTPSPVNFPSAGETYTVNNLGAVPNAGYPVGSLTDDNFNARTGGAYNNFNNFVFANSINFPAWQHPLDLHGSGWDIDRSNASGTQRLLRQTGRHQWPQYAYYKNNPSLKLFTDHNTTFLPGYTQRYQVDEPEETILEPALARPDLDSIFGPDENATLHIPQADQDILGLSGRMQALAPINFNGADGAATKARRQRFTSTSWDLKTFSRVAYDSVAQTDAKFRTWEFYDADSDGVGDGDRDGQGDVFPPRFPNAPPSTPSAPAGKESVPARLARIADREFRREYRRGPTQAQHQPVSRPRQRRRGFGRQSQPSGPIAVSPLDPAPIPVECAGSGIPSIRWRPSTTPSRTAPARRRFN